MHKIVQRLIRIENQIKEESAKFDISKTAKIIAIGKTFPLVSIMPLIEHGHLHFGENKVQEAKLKWTNIKKEKPKLNLHFVGKLQTNKVKDVVKLFDYVHSLENIKQAEVLYKCEREFKKKLKYFIQINIGHEAQKSGINPNDTKSFLEACMNKYDLDIIGLMCLPPNDKFPEKYFNNMKDLKMSLLPTHQYQALELSMGMSNDYISAINYGSTYTRIGTKIFGERK
jgi:pyridoxal phosphate enzyme (YggS family)